MRDHEPAQLNEILSSNYYEERRQPGVGLFFDTSHVKVGRQSLQNRLLFMRKITYPWHATAMSNDQIRIKMKHTFFQRLTDDGLNGRHSRMI